MRDGGFTSKAYLTFRRFARHFSPIRVSLLTNSRHLAEPVLSSRDVVIKAIRAKSLVSRGVEIHDPVSSRCRFRVSVRFHHVIRFARAGRPDHDDKHGSDSSGPSGQ